MVVAGHAWPWLATEARKSQSATDTTLNAELPTGAEVLLTTYTDTECTSAESLRGGRGRASTSVCTGAGTNRLVLTGCVYTRHLAAIPSYGSPYNLCTCPRAARPSLSPRRASPGREARPWRLWRAPPKCQGFVTLRWQITLCFTSSSYTAALRALLFLRPLAPHNTRGLQD